MSFKRFFYRKNSKTYYVLGEKLISVPFCTRVKYPSYHVDSYLRRFIKDLINNNKLI